MKTISSILFFLLLFNLQSFAQSGSWVWMKGSKQKNSLGNYGTMGVANSSNEPPARYQAAYWTDLQGNFWIFGGVTSVDTIGGYIESNDLWKYDITTNNWTWIGGMQAAVGITPVANYGTQGVPSSTNWPGGSGWGANCWTDHNGDLWLIGGLGFDNNHTYGLLSDLWRYNIATNQWTWMSGTGIRNYAGNFGTKGITAATNNPPGFSESKSSYIDAYNNLWMYGGASSVEYFNMLWKYDINNNAWTWMSGADTTNQTTNYGSLNVPSINNIPPARNSYTKWIDANDNIYIFSGDFAQTNDTWRYNPTVNEWTWIGGNLYPGDSGKFTAYCLNNAYPKATFENRTVQPLSCSNYFWDFGGFRTINGGTQNSLWLFDAKKNKWTLVNGSESYSAAGNYGLKGIPNSTNRIAGRGGSCMWLDKQANVWVFGGLCTDSTNGILSTVYKNDLWKFAPDTSCFHLPMENFTYNGIQLPQAIYWCKNQDTSIKLNGVIVISVEPSNTVHYSSDSSALIFSPLNTTTYQIKVTGGCYTNDTQTLSFTITYLPNPIADFTILNDTVASTNPIVQLNNTSQYSSSAIWYSNNQAVSTNFSNAAINVGGLIGKHCITLRAYNSAGCYDSVTKCVEVIESSIAMPNAFSPNGDGLNDFCEPIIFGDVTIKEFRIYNRWGQLLYNDIKGKWDGTFKSIPQPLETYIYTIVAEKNPTSSNGETIKLKGDIILLR